jgi:hypothetical protein
VLLLGLIAWGWLVAIQLLHLRDWQSLEANLRWNFVGRVVLKPFLAAGSPRWDGVSRASTG